jgi:HD-GYP domain-containing protein (c-di-GMP phosphodiesterase class II)
MSAGKRTSVPRRTAPKSEIRLIDLIMCLSDATDFIDPVIVDHHRQVAYVAYRIGMELGLPAAELETLILAGALHDVGAFSLRERRGTLEFEMSVPETHSESGYRLLRLFEPLSGAAAAVRHHHQEWDDGRGKRAGRRIVPEASHILHLADRVAVLIHRRREVLSQTGRICGKIRDGSGRLFKPELVDAFMETASKEYFWLDLASPNLLDEISEGLSAARFEIASEDMLGFAQLFSWIIDFKSPFTATHTSGVAASAETLATLAGFTERDRLQMRVAGYLHDLGKLAIPSEILEKPAGLVKREWNVIRHHTFYTYRILGSIPALQTVRRWGAFHHERLDGSGYPFHLKEKDLPLGSQIMAVADVFTAVAEDRPYRRGMKKKEILSVLDSMATGNHLNGDVVALLAKNYHDVNGIRRRVQSEATRRYRSLRAA